MHGFLLLCLSFPHLLTALPCNIEMLKMHLQKQKAYCITLVDNNVCTLTEISRKAAQWQACHFVSVILD